MNEAKTAGCVCQSGDVTRLLWMGERGVTDQKKCILRNEIRSCVSLWGVCNETGRDKRLRETGGKLPSPIEFEAVALGDCEERLDEPGGDD